MQKSRFLKIGCAAYFYPPGKEPPNQEPPLAIDNELCIPIDCDNASGTKGSDPIWEALRVELLKGLGGLAFTSLVLPFSSYHCIKEVHIQVRKSVGPIRVLTLRFSHVDGTITTRQFEIPRASNQYEWYSLPNIDLYGVIGCEIKCDPSDVWDISKNPWPFIYGLRLVRNPKLEKDPKFLLEKKEYDDRMKSEKKKREKGKVSWILDSSTTIEPLCCLGHGGFGEAILVQVPECPDPVVLKKMRGNIDESVVERCHEEFQIQQKLFMNPACFHRIARPMYILDLLDDNFDGTYGFLMEFCVGGSVSDFAKTWCKEDKDGVLDPQSDRFDYFDIMSLNPLKVSALCVGMIECLDDVFLVKKGIVHRDIKPENFLVRVDPKDGECTIILGDLGLTEILDSRSSSTSKILVSSKKVKKTEHERSICGTLIYNSYETLKYCVQDQRSDGYSLGLS
ncbi:hypothetical protein ADUPG1_007036, partial [Aduncisulcus paluster]